jgi:hypothetical protein
VVGSDDLFISRDMEKLWQEGYAAVEGLANNDENVSQRMKGHAATRGIDDVFYCRQHVLFTRCGQSWLS